MTRVPLYTTPCGIRLLLQLLNISHQLTSITPMVHPHNPWSNVTCSYLSTDYHGSLAWLYLLPKVLPVCLSLHNAEFQASKIWYLLIPTHALVLESTTN